MDAMPYAKETLVILTGYALGCFASGYYLVRWRTGGDVRDLGSGSVGARNVGRILGRTGFLFTLLLDFFKGTLAVWLAATVRMKSEPLMLTMLAVTAGHIWPAQLGFRGGKGVATSLGALLMYDYTIALIFAGLFAAAFGLIRNFVLAGMLAFAITPFVLFALGFPLTSVFGVSALAVLILISHRRNVPDEMSRLIAGRKLKGDKGVVSK
jgi:glycerol-3-phosphate acyltransferase PlsY